MKSYDAKDVVIILNTPDGPVEVKGWRPGDPLRVDDQDQVDAFLDMCYDLAQDQPPPSVVRVHPQTHRAMTARGNLAEAHRAARLQRRRKRRRSLCHRKP